MKMICDVPDEVIKSVRMGTWCGSSVAEKMIAKGIPYETVTEFADRCRECGRGKVLDKIRAEIDRQQKWLLHAGYTVYNVDIALDAIKSVAAESKEGGKDEMPKV